MPFGPYRNFSDCVRHNSHRANPKGYCATIMRQVEGKAAAPAPTPDYAQLANLLTDSHFWMTVKADFLAAVKPLFTELYLGGVEGGLISIRRHRKKDDTAPTDPEFDLLVSDPAFADTAAMFITSYSDNWWASMEESTRRSLAEIFFKARDEGWTMPEIEDAVAELFGPARAGPIAVTETTRLFGAGAQAAYRSEGVGEWEWRTVNDDRVDEVCDAMAAGSPYPMDQDFVPAHVNCLPGDALVSARGVLAATKRWYEGDLVVISGANGNQLSITPNHPIMTPTGWVAAGELVEGAEIIRPAGKQPSIRNDEEQVPTAIEQVARAVMQGRAMAFPRIPTTRFDLHGDGIEGGEVDVVRAAVALRDERDARQRHFVGEGMFEAAYARRALAQAEGLIAERPGGLGHSRIARTATGSMGRRDLSSASLVTHSRPFPALGVGLTADRYAGFKQPPANRKAVHTETLGDGILRLAGLIRPDDPRGIEIEAVVGRVGRVLKVGRRPFSGHVYNLETRAGYYLTSVAACSNCRCWPVPLDAGADTAQAGGAALDEAAA
jgi:hypothetical protein